MSDESTCRSCGAGGLNLLLDLGIQPLANNLLLPENLGGDEPRFPLRVMLCPECRLMQISDLVPPVELFGEYLYFSSFSDTMLRHAREAVEDYVPKFGLGADSLAVEIASNDGYLLQNFVERGIPCLGIEPAQNIAEVSREKGIETVAEFFGSELALRLVDEGRQADLILGNNVFAHVPSINDFVSGLKTLLKPGGRIVLEFPYAVDFLQSSEFDTVYHEHVFYFALQPLRPLFERHGLDLFHAERLSIHGGSLRLFACHRGEYEISAEIQAMSAEEVEWGIEGDAVYEEFSRSAKGIREDLLKLIGELKAEGKTIAAYGASAKGSTLLNFCGIGCEELDFIADRSSAKQGRLSPGAHIPIVGSDELAARQPDYTLLLTWNFAEEILKQQQAYRDAGGKFIVPIPEVRVV